MDLDYRMQETGIEMIRSALGELLPGVTFLRIDRQNRQLLFDTPDGVVPLQQLSDGYQNMASWTGDLLFRITETFGNYRRPLAARGLLLLDEIDLHLHPVWQRELLLFLDRKLPNLQILATTHSPFTAQQASPGALHVLERISTKGAKAGVLRARQYNGDPKLLRVDQLLEPLLGLETTESLAAQRVREKQRDLRGKSSRTQAEEKTLAQLTTAVRVLPQAQALDAPERARLDLLRRIELHLEGEKSPRGTAKSRKDKTAAAAGLAPAVAAEATPPAEAIENVFHKMALQPEGLSTSAPKAQPKSRSGSRKRGPK
jgi:hypothetical protein